MRAFTSDWHLIGEKEPEPADRNLIIRFVDDCIEEGVEEVILGGDIFDRTRDANQDAIVFVATHVLARLASNDIYTTILWGNHEADFNAAAEIARSIAQLAVDPKEYCFADGTLERGKFSLKHGHEFDPWCSEHGSFRTTVGEIATKFDHLGDHIGVNLETIDPTKIFIHVDSIELDPALHMRANRWASRNKKNLIYGHSHCAYTLIGKDWSVFNSGSLTRGHRVEYILFDEEFAQLIQK